MSNVQTFNGRSINATRLQRDTRTFVGVMEKYLKKTLGKEYTDQLMARVKAAVPGMKKQLPDYKSFLTTNVAHGILPVIALYKALLEDGHEDAFDIVYRYLTESVGGKNNRLYGKLENVPGFFPLFKALYWFLLKHNNMCDYEFGSKDKKHFNFFVTRCLWVDLCRQFGCPELTVCWCHADTASYKGLRRLEFRRSVTLAEDGKPCDYCFVRK